MLAGRESSPGLTERQTGILHSIVRAYIDTGEPVGSRTHFAHAQPGAQPGHYPERDGGSGRRRLSGAAAHLGRPRTHRQAFRDFAGTVSARPLSAADRDRIFDQMQSGEALKSASRSLRAC